jgi:hypothetical protein
MASKSLSKQEVMLGLSVVGLVMDLLQAARHKQTCPKCRTRDFLAVALDVGHLLEATWVRTGPVGQCYDAYGLRDWWASLGRSHCNAALAMPASAGSVLYGSERHFKWQLSAAGSAIVIRRLVINTA